MTDLFLPQIEIKSATLENGFALSANESKNVDSVNFSGSIRAGSIYDEEGKFGTAEIVSRLLTRGTKSDPSASAVSKKIEELGATLQFTNEDERVRFTAKCHSSVVRELLKIMSECMMAPSFTQYQIEFTKAEIISDIEAEQDETRTRAYRLLMPLIYGEKSPLGRNPMGDTSHIRAVSSEDIAEFYNKYYLPSRTLLVATGNFDFSDLASQVDLRFGKWENKSNSRSSSSSSASRNELESAISSDLSASYNTRKTAKDAKLKIDPMNYKSQVDIAMGMLAVSRKSDYYYPLSLGNLLLGQIGLYGRLGKNVREDKGVAYYSFSSLVAKTISGYIAVYAGVNPKNVSRAIEGIAEEISRIQFQEIGEEELTRGKRNALGSLAISLDTSSERVGIIHEIEYYHLGGSKYFEKHEKRINSVTSDQILTAFAEFANPSKISMSVVGPIQDPDQIRLPSEILQKEV
jgi:zinc protease